MFEGRFGTGSQAIGSSAREFAVARVKGSSDEQYSFGGRSQTLREWAVELDLSPAYLRDKIRNQGIEAALGQKRMGFSAAGRRGGRRGWGRLMRSGRP
jgi:hypothetical protein